MRSHLGMLRNITLAAFAMLSLAQPARAQAADNCYSCGSCTCCDEGGQTACFIDCPNLGYCDCCGKGACQGSYCH
jgi:hypothetical protein